MTMLGLKARFFDGWLGRHVLGMLSLLSLLGCGGVSFEIAEGDDTGPSEGLFKDKLTNKRTLKLDVAGGTGGKEVEIVEGSSVLGTGTLDKNSGSASITVNLSNEDSVTAAGDTTPNKNGYDHELILRYKDGGEISRITVRLDDVKPEKPVLSALESREHLLKIFSDSQATSEIVSYKVSNVEDGSTVRLYGTSNNVIGELTNVSGSEQIVRARVTVGESVTAKVFDQAGNESSVSDAYVIRSATTSSLAFDDSGDKEGVQGMDGFDKEVKLTIGSKGEWLLETSLLEDGLVYFEQEGEDEVLEVGSVGASHDVAVLLEEGRWYMWIEGEDKHLIGVGSGYSDGIA